MSKKAPARCHYEVLGIPLDSTPDQIKRAYYKMAMVHHPDKNENSEESTRIFTEIQSSYEVLSDPNEKAWYDDHRTSILRGIDPDEPIEFFNIWPYFSRSCFTDFSNNKGGFYAVYSEVFDTIEKEEEEFCDSKLKYKKGPSFGDDKTSYNTVKEFYVYWNNFQTKKSFSWLDEYKTTDAPNRWAKRQGDKENKKTRDVEKKKLNELIRKFAMTVQKMDPRVSKAQESIKKQKEQNEAQKREMEEFFKAEMQKSSKEKRTDFGEGIDLVDEDMENDVEAILELQRLKKKGKKGKKKQYSSDEDELILEEEPVEEVKEETLKSDLVQEEVQEEDQQEEELVTKKKDKKDKKKKKKKGIHQETFGKAQEEEENVEIEPEPEVPIQEEEEFNVEMIQAMKPKKKPTKMKPVEPELQEREIEIKEEQEEEKETVKSHSASKKEKRKQKEAELRKTSDQQLKCNVCSAVFDSRSKLFQHLKDEGHEKFVEIKKKKK